MVLAIFTLDTLSGYCIIAIKMIVIMDLELCFAEKIVRS
jgi:hypothetical protein